MKKKYFYFRRSDGEHTMMTSDGVQYILKAYRGHDWIHPEEVREIEKVWNS